MYKSYLRSLLVFFIVFTVLITLIAGVRNVCGSNGYDDQEAIRRGAEKLVEYDRAQREAARQRYDATHYSSSSDSETGGAMCILTIIAIAIGVTISWAKKSKIKETKAREAEYKKKEKELADLQLKKAESLGFSIDNDTKTCPACAEKIKIKATTCRYCKKEFSDLEVLRAIQSSTEAFLSIHGSDDKSNG